MGQRTTPSSTIGSISSSGPQNAAAGGADGASDHRCRLTTTALQHRVESGQRGTLQAVTSVP